MSVDASCVIVINDQLRGSGPPLNHDIGISQNPVMAPVLYPQTQAVLERPVFKPFPVLQIPAMASLVAIFPLFIKFHWHDETLPGPADVFIPSMSLLRLCLAMCWRGCAFHFSKVQATAIPSVVLHQEEGNFRSLDSVSSGHGRNFSRERQQPTEPEAETSLLERTAGETLIVADFCF